MPALVSCFIREVVGLKDQDLFINEIGIKKFVERSSILFVFKLLKKCIWYKDNKSDDIKSELVDFVDDEEFMSNPDREPLTAEIQQLSIDLISGTTQIYEAERNNAKKIEDQLALQIFEKFDAIKSDIFSVGVFF